MMMNNNLVKTVICGTALVFGTLAGCKKNNDNPELPPSGPDIWDRQYITLTGAFPDASGTAGNGGTMAYAITLEQANDPNFEINVFNSGYGLRSERTARVQGSINGNFLYNIQYTGNDGGIFNKYKVEGGSNFVDTHEEVNTEPILGTAPRWVLAAEGIGIGVYAKAEVKGTSEGADADFVSVKSNAKIAVLDLNDPQITRQADFEIPFSEDQKANGYQISRIDVPILNKAKTKVFIGCNLSRIDITKKSTFKDDRQRWSTGTRELGTATLVVDYPSLSNPKLIYSENSKVNNNSYRTMSQYVGTDGHVYQATATSGSQILRISSTTNEYDNSFNFDLKTALNASNNLSIRAWKYIKDGLGIVMYTEKEVDGGYLALIDLNAGTAFKLSTDNQTNVGFSGQSADEANNKPSITGSFSQFQNIGIIGENVYIPMTPNGLDGILYIINAKTKQVKKGAKLKNQSGSYYIGAY